MTIKESILQNSVTIFNVYVLKAECQTTWGKNLKEIPQKNSWNYYYGWRLQHPSIRNGRIHFHNVYIYQITIMFTLNILQFYMWITSQ